MLGHGLFEPFEIDPAKVPSLINRSYPKLFYMFSTALKIDCLGHQSYLIKYVAHRRTISTDVFSDTGPQCHQFIGNP